MRLFFIGLIAVGLSACSTDVMTSSGRAYIEKSKNIDPAIAAAASVEPDLKFPANIGIVRLVYGQVTNMPDAEREYYKDTLPSALGLRVFLTPLDEELYGRSWKDPLHVQLRKLAASRHLDYLFVLSYDPETNSASAAFLDVRTGYSYASTTAQAHGRGKTNFWGGHLRNQTRLNAVTLKLAKALAPNLREAVKTLVAEAT